MVDLLGFEVPVGDIDFAGFFANTWWYLLIIVLITFILVVAIVIIFFFLTYNKRIEFYENVSGMGFRRISTKRARTLKLGLGGEEVLKVLGGLYLSAYGRKIGNKTYMFVKGQDGYWYNCVHGDLDAKMNTLDIEPIDRDVRMYHLALERLAHQTYGKSSFLEKYGIHLMLFFFLIVMLIGFWLIAGKINEGLVVSADTSRTNQAVVGDLRGLLLAQENINNEGGTGIVPAPPDS